MTAPKKPERRKIPGTSMYYPKQYMKRSPISRTTTDKEKAKDDRQLKKIRADWLKKFKRCMVCNRRKPESVHEIKGGNKWRHITEHNPVFWLAVCDGPFGCHSKIQNDPQWPESRQLAHKLVHNPKDFDLIEYNRILVKEVDVTMPQIDGYLDSMAG